MNYLIQSDVSWVVLFYFTLFYQHYSFHERDVYRQEDMVLSMDLEFTFTNSFEIGDSRQALGSLLHKYILTTTTCWSSEKGLLYIVIDAYCQARGTLWCLINVPPRLLIFGNFSHLPGPYLDPPPY